MHTESIEAKLQELNLCTNMKVWWNSSRARKGYAGCKFNEFLCLLHQIARIHISSFIHMLHSTQGLVLLRLGEGTTLTSFL